MPRRTHFRLALALLALAVVGFSPCGAEDVSSPSANTAPEPETCGDFESLAPNLDEALRTQQLSGLKSLVEQLSATPADGSAPPMNEVLEALFVALNEFGQDPPEAGNTDGLCNEVNPPPLEQTNRLCDLRRTLKIYVHEGRANESLHKFDPVIAGVLNYVIGVEPSADTPHYEIAADIEAMCQTTGQCDPHDTFDLLQGVTAYLTPGHAQALLNDTQALLDDPALGSFFSSAADGGASGGQSLGGAGFELVADTLLCTLMETDASRPASEGGPFKDLNNTINNLVYPLVDSQFPAGTAYDLPDGGIAYSNLHVEISNAMADLEDMLDPNASEPVLQPLLNVMQCATAPGTVGTCTIDRVPRQGLVQMIYHLGFEAHVVGLDEILAALEQLIQTDAASEEPGMVMKILHDIAAALNRDDEALGALTDLCNVAFSTERPCDDGEGNECPALPLNYSPPGKAFAPLQDGCVNGAGASYSVPDAACLSNAEAVTPEVSQLFSDGVTDEVLCVLDTLVYGCTGGSRPACGGSVSPDGGR